MPSCWSTLGKCVGAEGLLDVKHFCLLIEAMTRCLIMLVKKLDFVPIEMFLGGKNGRYYFRAVQTLLMPVVDFQFFSFGCSGYILVKV